MNPTVLLLPDKQLNKQLTYGDLRRRDRHEASLQLSSTEDWCAKSRY